LATGSDVGTASAKPSADKALPNSDTKGAEDARIPDYKPSASLVRAQQYIRGTGGVSQNCEQGLLYLHAATDKSDPGAAIQMAALYSSGICVKQDRVMAYRWFNSAHELQPANVWIQRNMDQLWAQMSSQERRLAGY
jgi:TPR repeat protein